ncbi:D-2-hydroxyacid dehydrogenase [Peptococcus niger]|uniref:D-3-phosphoglycerate dehydrogenase n=1 Tax=Peptococcus niger TaxID=2741 RepID=A0A1G6SZB5_PEPNI|nr:D-2-hydroxyacid dehydrogenase [Peptococcus niger]SDD22252.1 D-3-phosphoglycerate dehydrogenase [Peptococcus niger]
MKILITDGLAKDAIAALQEFAEVDEHFYEPDALGEALKDYDAVIIRSATQIRQAQIDIAKTGQLKLIVRAGVGIDNIDHAYAKDQGIHVRNTPSANANAMAELTLAQLFAVSRFIAAANVTMRKGEWNKKNYRGVELAGKTLGLIGFGHTARLLADKCAALGMDILYYDIVGADDQVPYTYADMADLIQKADFITLHTPASKDGKPLLDGGAIASMKDGVRLVNCARGGLIDEAALLEALTTGKVAAAGLDVFVGEPDVNLDLVNHPNVSVTPHLGAQTYEAQTRVGKEVVDVVKEELC